MYSKFSDSTINVSKIVFTQSQRFRQVNGANFNLTSVIYSNILFRIEWARFNLNYGGHFRMLHRGSKSHQVGL